MELAEQLRLGDEPDAVPRARRFASEALTRLGYADLTTDAEIVVSELVTNAVLHGTPPVVIRVASRGPAVRVSVADGSRSAPMRSLPDAQAMTGRGIVLVDALSSRWGVTLVPHGKTVWCELDAGAFPGASDQEATDFPDDEEMRAELGDHLVAEVANSAEAAEPVFTVTLGDVPTDLLIAAKGHVDNLVREFILAAAGAESGSTAAVPPPLTTLIETVVHRFADARRAIKRQALTAAGEGAERTHLSLILPLSAADAGDAYLAALDEADAYARAARLLTLETPPQHRAFRKWYVQALVTKLRAIAAGLPPPETETFEQRLLSELELVSDARRSAVRAARLQAVTSALAGAITIDDVTSVVVREGLDALGATSGSVLLRAEQDRVAVLAATGYTEDTLDAMRAERVDAELPAATVLRSGDAVWLESRQEIEEAFPGLGRLEPRTQSLCAVPATTVGRVLGALRFSFTSPRLFDEEERRFVFALAAQTAQALDRSFLYTAERAARSAAELLASRLRRLQRISGQVSAASDVETVAKIVIAHIQEALPVTGASVCLLEGPESLRILGVAGVRADLVDRFEKFGLHDRLPASEAVRLNAPVVVHDRDELLRRYPDLRGTRPRASSLVCIPLQTHLRPIGAISVQFSQGHDVDDADEQTFLGSLADVSSQAIERTLAQIAARDAADRMTFLGDASAELAASLDYRATLAKVVRLVVPRLADWCGVHLVKDGEFEPVAVAHVDPGKVRFVEELQRRYPIDPQSPTGVANVVRTGRSELYARITDELLVHNAVDDEHLRMIRELRLCSALVVPLRGPDRIIGALTLVSAESQRHFGESDLRFAEEIARRGAVAVENARQYQRQRGRLAAITRVAEAVQHAILAPVPSRVGSISLAGAYVSATPDALVGGDLYEVVPGPGYVRLLIGDVRGKGLDAVRLAAVVLGYFRAAAGDAPTPVDVARLMDRRLARHLGGEDFVTAMIVEISDVGRVQIVSCGHPGPIMSDGKTIRELTCPPALPLGLGSRPQTLEFVLDPGERLLLYTDGLIEARNADGEFTNLAEVVEPLRSVDVPAVLDRILANVAAKVGDLDDDLALLVAEFRPETQVQPPV